MTAEEGRATGAARRPACAGAALAATRGHPRRRERWGFGALLCHRGRRHRVPHRGREPRTTLKVAAQLGILTIAVTLLMIAGEFDLSVGSMLAAAGVLMTYPVVELGWPLGPGLALAFAGATLVGLINGFLVIRTALPSFIVTLAGLFILRGVTIAVTHDITGGATQVGGVDEATSGSVVRSALAGELFGLPAAVYWWIGLTLVATVVLAKTRFGNWIYGAGGDAGAAAKLGVPAARVKITLFVLTALAASLVAAIGVLVNGAADVQQGQLKEFQAITAAVIGGTLLTGGYGTVDRRCLWRTDLRDGEPGNLLHRRGCRLVPGISRRDAALRCSGQPLLHAECRGGLMATPARSCHRSQIDHEDLRPGGGAAGCLAERPRWRRDLSPRGQRGRQVDVSIKVLSGVFRPDAGQLLVNGSEVVVRVPAAAHSMPASPRCSRTWPRSR